MTRSKALADFDDEMRRFAALPREEQEAELRAMLEPSVGDAAQDALIGSVYDALMNALDGPAPRP